MASAIPLVVVQALTETDPLSSFSRIATDWDCIVIGGGPSGALAARHCAQLGLSTLIVEQKSYPRPKVCGACLNHRAISLLQFAGLADLIDQCGGIAINEFHLRAYGGEVRRELPSGVAISRQRLDAALMQSAVEAGATCLSSTTAKVMPKDDEIASRRVRLVNHGVGKAVQCDKATQCELSCNEIFARVVIAADGLGHPSLRLLDEFPEHISTRSYVGIGATVANVESVGPRAGCIQMAVSRHGYAGIVRVEEGRLNLAAAVAPKMLKGTTPAHAFNEIRRAAGFPEICGDQSRWMGTPAISRMSTRVAGDRIFLIGDAAGYVEPFTGEGMTWALVGGHRVAKHAASAVTRKGGKAAVEIAAADWQQDWSTLIQRRQKWCRRFAWLLRHPVAAKCCVSVVSHYPRMTDAIVSQMNLKLSASS